MEAGDVIAVYAAVVATGALTWQVFAWRHQRTLRVQVELKYAMFPMTSGGVEEGITITAVNRSEGAVRATGAGLNLQDGSGRTLVIPQQPPGADIPCTIQPNDSAMTYVYSSHIEASVDLYKPLSAFVNLATGETVTSKPTTLWRR